MGSESRPNTPRSDRIKVRYGRTEVEHEGVVTYLQRGGFGLHGQRSFPQGATLRFTLEPDSGEELELRGEVLWVRDFSHLVSMGSYCELGVRPHDAPKEYANLVDRRDRSQERREHPRFPDMLEVAFDDVEDFVEQYTENISHGGLRLRSDAPLALGHVFNARLVVPDVLQTVSFSGEVMHVAEHRERGATWYSLGIKFLDMSDEASQTLSEHVERLRQRFSF